MNGLVIVIPLRLFLGSEAISASPGLRCGCRDEHLKPDRLAAFERVLFECAQSKSVIVTTPNIEYNALCETLPAGQLRHRNPRFEWTRQ